MGFPAESSSGEKVIIVEVGMAGDRPIYRTEDNRRWMADMESGGQHKLKCIDEPVVGPVAEPVVEEVTVEQIGFDQMTPLEQQRAELFGPTGVTDDGTEVEVEDDEDEDEWEEADGGEVIEINPELDASGFEPDEPLAA